MSSSATPRKASSASGNGSSGNEAREDSLDAPDPPIEKPAALDDDALLEQLRVINEGSTFTYEPEFQRLLEVLECDAPTRTALNSDGSTVSEIEPGPLGRIGRFQLERQLGRGSFGVVFLAIDTVLRRRVALKMPRVDTMEAPEIRQRFLREGQAASGLNHPHILPVYEAGTKGLVYIASQYCWGPTLSTWLEKSLTRPSHETTAQLVADLADAVQHAHDSGVLHRDIKPSNILLQPRETRSDDEPRPEGEIAGLESYVAKLADFGLAKFLDRDSETTASGALLGTVKYMSPEQATGNTSQISESSDIYALGVLLYELLTGRTPLAGQNDAETIRNIAERDPAPVRSLDPTISRDLEAICLQCLRKSPERRYSSAGALRDDLQRLLGGRPIRARPPLAHERLLRWGRQNPVVAAVLGSSLIALLAWIIGLSQHSGRLNNALRETEQQRQLAQRNANEAQDLLYAAEMRLALRAWRSGDPRAVAEQLERCRPKPNEVDRRGWEWRWLSGMLQRSDYLVKAHRGPIYACVASPDGRLVATAGKDGAIRVWNPGGEPLFQLLGHQDEINDLAIAPDSRTLASTSDDGTVRLWDLKQRTERRVLSEHEGSVYGVAFSPDGRWLATGGEDHRLLLRRPSGDVIAEGSVGESAVEELRFFPDSEKLAVASGVDIQLWDVEPYRRATTLTGEGPITNVAVSADGRVVAGGGHHGKLFLWDARNGRLEETLGDGTSWLLDIAFTPDGRSIATSHRNGSVRVWPLFEVRQEEGFHVDRSVHALAVSPNGQQLATASYYGKTELWTRDGQRLAVGREKTVRDVQFLPDGEALIAIGRTDPWITISDAKTMRPIRQLRRERQLRSLAVAPDGRSFAVAEESTIAIFRYPELDIVRELRHEANVNDIAYSATGELASVSDDKSARVWNLADGRVRLLIPHADTPECVALAPDGGAVVTGDNKGRLRAWNAASGKLLASRKAHSLECQDLAFSPNGALLASTSSDHLLGIWDTRQWRCMHWTELDRPLRSADFAPNGTTLYTTAVDGVVRSWRIKRGESESIDAHPERAWSLCFLSERGELLTTGHQGELKLWRNVIRQPPPTQGLGQDAVGVAFHPRTGALASAGFDQSVSLWRPDLQRRPEVQPPQPVELEAVAHDPAGRWLAIARADGTIQIQIAGAGGEVHGVLQGHEGRVAGMAFSPDGERLASIASEPRVVIWDVKQLRLEQEIPLDPQTTPSSLAISPDGRLLAVDAEQTIRVFQLGDLQLLTELGHSNVSAESMCFSQDGGLLASGHANGEIRLWDMRRKSLLRVLRGHRGFVAALMFSPDGRTLASGGDDLRLWHTVTGQDFGILADDPDLSVHALAFSPDGDILAAACSGRSRLAGIRLFRGARRKSLR